MTSICWRQQNDLKLRGIEIEKFFPDFSSSQKNLKFFKFFSGSFNPKKITKGPGNRY